MASPCSRALAMATRVARSMSSIPDAPRPFRRAESFVSCSVAMGLLAPADGGTPWVKTLMTPWLLPRTCA